MRLVLILATAAILAACTSEPVKPAWAYYDDCEALSANFVEMVACGKAKRLEVCRATPERCGDIGNAVASYADSLSRSVSTKTMSEPEAQRKWIEFKMARSDQRRQEILQRDSIAASSGPRFCNTTGNSTICY